MAQRLLKFVSVEKAMPAKRGAAERRHDFGEIYGEFDAELAELNALREMRGGADREAGAGLEARLQSLCEAALPGKRIDVNDNLFEIGASSLKLIEIHESIDRDFPGLVDLTELFDYPTIAQLAKHLEAKLKATPPR